MIPMKTSISISEVRAIGFEKAGTDHSGKIWRIVKRIACSGDDEAMTLREVGGDTEITVSSARELILYLEMVAMSKSA